MIVVERVLDPILKKLNPPNNCPMIFGYGDFRAEADLVGGYKSTPDLAHVTCVPVCRAKCSSDIHPACKDCKIANKKLIPMKEYREMIGLKD